MLITRVLAWPGADTRHSELNLELRRRVPGNQRKRPWSFLDKREMVWPGAQAREGRKQDDTSWTDAGRELGSKRLHKVATGLYQRELLKGEVRNESRVVGPRALNWHSGGLPPARAWNTPSSQLRFSICESRRGYC